MMKNKKYWEQRALQRENKANKNTERYLKKLKKQYEKAMKDIENEISIFYAKFAVDNDISYQDAQEYLRPKERKVFQDRLSDFIEMVENNVKGQFNTEIRNMSNRVRITRYQELLTEIRAIIEKLYGDKYTGYEPSTYNLLSDAYEQSYYRGIYDTQIGLGIGKSFSRLNRKAIDEAINYPWSGESFSNRIWEQKAKLLLNMRTTITQGMIQGLSVDKMVTNLSNKMNVAYLDAERLVRTETNHVFNNATLRGYKEEGVEKYQYLATLDSRTSNICRELDGKVFNVDDARVGINVPPLHVRCRSTTVAHFDDEDESEYERLAKSSEGKYYKVPANMDYRTWGKTYIQKDINNDIIKEREINKTTKKLFEGYNYDDKTLRVIDSAFDEVLEYGKKNDIENLYHLDIKTSKKGTPTLTGTNNQVVFTEDLINYLQNAKENSVLSIHNHPRSSSFSPADLMVLKNYNSIKALSVIGHDGTKYLVSVGEGIRPSNGMIEKVYKQNIDKYQDGMIEKIKSGELDEKSAWKEHSHLAVKDLTDKFKWKYERVIPDE